VNRRSTCIGAALLAIAATGLGVADGPTPLVASVAWTDANGTDGTLQFEGIAEGTTLSGIARGGGQEFKVDGTVSSDGSMSGTLSDENGGTIGTFSASLDGQYLEGSYDVAGQQGGAFTSPAEDLPIPPE